MHSIQSNNLYLFSGLLFLFHKIKNTNVFLARTPQPYYETKNCKNCIFTYQIALLYCKFSYYRLWYDIYSHCQNDVSSVKVIYLTLCLTEQRFNSTRKFFVLT